MKQGLALTALAFLLAGCNGGDETTSSESEANKQIPQARNVVIRNIIPMHQQHMKNVSATGLNAENAGLFEGSYLNGDNETGTMTLFVTTDGRSYLLSDDTELVVGTAEKTATGIKTTGNIYQDASDNWGALFTSNLHYNMNTLSGPYTLPGVAGQFSLIHRADVLNRSVDMASLNGEWIDEDNEIATISNGMFTHLDKTDCDVSGVINQQDGLNQFNFSMFTSGCADPDADGFFTGLIYLSDNESGQSNQLNIMTLDSSKEWFAIETLSRK